MVEAYCVKCKAKREIKNAALKKGEKVNSITGVCAKCGTKVHRFVSKKT